MWHLLTLTYTNLAFFALSTTHIHITHSTNFCTSTSMIINLEGTCGMPYLIAVCLHLYAVSSLCWGISEFAKRFLVVHFIYLPPCPLVSRIFGINVRIDSKLLPWYVISTVFPLPCHCDIYKAITLLFRWHIWNHLPLLISWSLLCHTTVCRLLALNILWCPSYLTIAWFFFFLLVLYSTRRICRWTVPWTWTERPPTASTVVYQYLKTPSNRRYFGNLPWQRAPFDPKRIEAGWEVNHHLHHRKPIHQGLFYSVPPPPPQSIPLRQPLDWCFSAGQIALLTYHYSTLPCHTQYIPSIICNLPLFLIVLYHSPRSLWPHH